MILVVGLLILAVLCAVSIYYANTNVYIKALLIIPFILSSLFGFIIIESYMGHPLYVLELPPEIVVYGQKIDNNFEFIYLMYSTLDSEEVMAVYVDYQMPLHEVLNKGLEMFKGESFVLENLQAGEGKGKNGDGKENGKEGEIMSYSHESVGFAIRAMPQIDMPPK